MQMGKENTPAIILMVPQMGENIGAAARAMANFGMSDLRLVNPRDGWPNERAEAMSAGALPELVRVSVFQTLDEAIADIQYLTATTARRREMNKPAFTSGQAAKEIIQRTLKNIKTGILFGRERNGLENDEIGKCHSVIHVPTSPDFASINLAQCVLLMTYEIFQQSNHQVNIPDTIVELAENKDVSDFLNRLEQELEKGEFFRSEGLRPTMIRNIKNIFTRCELTVQEVNTLQGIITALKKSGQ